MLPDYLTINGIEIVNTIRADTYLSADGGCDVSASCLDCDTWVDLINDGEPYETVTTDPAPWYDSRVPESARIWGFSGLSVTGLDTAVYPQPGTDTESPTGVQRDFSWRLQVDAADECALSYAIGWLVNAVAKPACDDGTGCGGGTACMIACCPTDPDNDDVARFIYGIEVIEGPRIVDQGYDDHGITAEIEIVMRTTNPRIYREPAHRITITPGVDGDLLTDFSLTAREQCPDPFECGVDPECPAPPYTPPVAPPLDPCFPDRFDARRVLVPLDQSAIPADLDTAMVVTITAGDGVPIRNTAIRFHQNPLGIDCARAITGSDNACSAMCADMISLYQPAGSTLVMDGRSESSTLTCPSSRGTSTSVPRLFGLNGYGAFRYPVVACGGGVCIEVITDATAVNTSTTIVIDFVPRQEAG